MKRIVYIIISLFSTFSIFSQYEIAYIDLKPEKFTLPDYSFNIVKVIDDRVNTKMIGIVQLGILNTEVIADMKGGVEDSFSKFL